MDFPREEQLPPFISTYSSYSVFNRIKSVAQPSSPASASAAWPVANLAIFIPIYIPAPYPIKRMGWANGSAATGNSSIGLFDKEGRTLFASATTAIASASNPQYVTLSSALIVAAGWYYLGRTVDSTTANQARGTTLTANAAIIASAVDVGRYLGMREMASAHPLGTAAATSATYAQSANVLYPLLAITRTSS